MRIQQHPILDFDQNKRLVHFVFEGQDYEGFEDEPIACALFAVGIKVLGHSHNDNRPRGIYCAIGNCSSCLATVNGVSNVRICTERLKEGMVITMQHGRGRIAL